MIHVVSFSGGRTSAYLVSLLEEKRKSEGWDVRYMFMDTGAEHPRTYEFIRKVVDHFGIELHCLKTHFPDKLGKGPVPEKLSIDEIGWDLSTWRSMIYKHSTPFNPGGGFCTERLKTEIARKYIRQNWGKEITQWIGIRADEPRRLKEKPGFRYLAELSDFEKQDVLDWWSEMPFDLELEEHLGNCVFCIKKNPPKVALAMRDEPELAEEWSSMFEEGGVRDLGRKFPKEQIYRWHFTPRKLLETFAEFPRDELMGRVRRTRYLSGGCSESCEAFISDD
ncbi:phosphoadenosine phosphosulfate reductase family protein [Ferrimonas balearica]|uniref:phosphoadenosine phosphosulfate reductase domain-containing protein n=1 Tax=Ferrimonas balearica TaxID=44012 RepID=UPI001C993071|nr:phosphoadenosine phosphosulfate reductase family protein [Ferrimonas balearica]MBY5992498.1 phosphoadenosine phosphosulfate reductase family protein [Ferrimonas balearica]